MKYLSSIKPKKVGQPHTFLNNPANISQQLAKAKQ